MNFLQSPPLPLRPDEITDPMEQYRARFSTFDTVVGRTSPGGIGCGRSSWRSSRQIPCPRRRNTRYPRSSKPPRRWSRRSHHPPAILVSRVASPSLPPCGASNNEQRQPFSTHVTHSRAAQGLAVAIVIVRGRLPALQSDEGFRLTKGTVHDPADISKASPAGRVCLGTSACPTLLLVDNTFKDRRPTVSDDIRLDVGCRVAKAVAD